MLYTIQYTVFRHVSSCPDYNCPGSEFSVVRTINDSKVLADCAVQYVTDDAWNVKFSQIEGNGRKFRHIELSNIASSVKFSNGVSIRGHAWV